MRILLLSLALSACTPATMAVTGAAAGVTVGAGGQRKHNDTLMKFGYSVAVAFLLTSVVWWTLDRP